MELAQLPPPRHGYIRGPIPIHSSLLPFSAPISALSLLRVLLRPRPAATTSQVRPYRPRANSARYRRAGSRLPRMIGFFSSFPTPPPRSMGAGARNNGHACRFPLDTGGPGLRPPALDVDLRCRHPLPEHRRRCPPPPPPPSESRRSSRARARAHPSRCLLLESAAAHCGGGLSDSPVRRAGPAPLAALLSCFGGVSD